MSDDPQFLRSENNHVYADTSGKNGRSLLGKLVLSISAPIIIASVVNVAMIARWTGEVDEKLVNITEKFDSFVRIQQSLMERVRILELENAARRGIDRNEVR